MNHPLACLLHDLPALANPSHGRPFALFPPPPQAIHMYAQSSTQFHMPWPPQAPYSQSTLFASPLAPSSWTNAGPSVPPDFLLPFHHYPQKDHDAVTNPVPRSDTSSAASRDSDLSPSPQVAEVVCNAPLVAPIPLPYHSPTFLLYDLPDEDEDLSHPPYTHRPHKRKRARDEDDEDTSRGQEAQQREPHPVPAKRRSIGVAPGMPRWDSGAHAPWAGSAASASAAPAPAALRRPAAAFSRRHHRAR
ncbi:hypothetical protein BD414DRAFT_407556 [Trametes punicea]|nr:hypothetical protein BD414DRAFT_407556 [Trametes punicea]